MTAPKLTVRFFRTLQDNEPVRERLKALSVAERKAIGEEIRTVQFGWPLGMPLVRKLDVDLWEVRVRLKDRIDGSTTQVAAQGCGEEVRAGSETKLTRSGGD